MSEQVGDLVAELARELFNLAEAGGAFDSAIKTGAPNLLRLASRPGVDEVVTYDVVRQAISNALDHLQGRAGEKVIVRNAVGRRPSATRSWGVPEAAKVLRVLLNPQGGQSGARKLGSRYEAAVYAEASNEAGGSPSVRTIQRGEIRMAMARHLAYELLRYLAHANDGSPPPISSSVTRRSSGYGSAQHPTLPLLKERATSQFMGQIALLTGGSGGRHEIADSKYIPAVFVERGALGRQFAEFETQEARALALVGDAGLGKTNLLCFQALTLAKRHPVLFYRGSMLVGSLTRKVCHDLGLGGTAPVEDLVALADRLLTMRSEILYIFLDAINEASEERAALREDINDLIDKIGKARIKLVVSCRTLDWGYWLRDSGNMLNSLGRACRWTSDPTRNLQGALPVDLLTDEEFDTAWEKYKRHFKLIGAPSARMRKLCREPYMLRLVAEVYRDQKPIPPYVHPLQLFERYLDEKFSPASAHVEHYRLLYWIGQRVLQSGRPWISVEEIGSGDMDACRSLLDENVIIFEREGKVEFHFELFMEFIVCRSIIARTSKTSSSLERMAIVRTLTDIPLLNAPGIVENLVLSWQDDPSFFAATLEHLVARNDEEWDKWRVIACSVIRKTNVAAPALEAALGVLTRDPNYVIRLFLAEALGRDTRNCDPNGVAHSLANDHRSWEARETSANIFAAARSTSRTSLNTLWRLADDYHWRVRRAAGYALREIWRLNDVDVSVHKNNVLSSSRSTWRQKYAICIALQGSQDAQYRDIVRAKVWNYSRDRNPQVRWAVAMYLDRYRNLTVPFLARQLASDVDPWVRSRLVSSLVIRARQDDRDALPLLAQLAGDEAPAVRLAVAREMRWLTPSKVVEDMLNSFVNDLPDVRFAATYTMHTLNIEKITPDQAGSLLGMRERVARCEMDVTRARFAPIEQYVLRRSEFVPQKDSYMQLIDSMAEIIASSSEAVRTMGRSEFLRLLRDDRDEAVRWALVHYLTDWSANETLEAESMTILRDLTADQHWWVRREVAANLQVFRNGSQAAEALSMLRGIELREPHLGDECRDEVLHFCKLSRKLFQLDPRVDQ